MIEAIDTLTAITLKREEIWRKAGERGRGGGDDDDSSSSTDYRGENKQREKSIVII